MKVSTSTFALGLLLTVASPCSVVRASDPGEQILLERANFWRAQHRPDLAAEMLRKILAFNPTQADGLFQVGVMEVEQGNLVEARRYFDRLLLAAPVDARAAELITMLPQPGGGAPSLPAPPVRPEVVAAALATVAPPPVAPVKVASAVSRLDVAVASADSDDLTVAPPVGQPGTPVIPVPKPLLVAIHTQSPNERQLAAGPGIAADDAGGDTASLQAKQEALFQQMLLDPSNLSVIFAYAEVSARLGNNEAALSALERMLLFNPNLPRVDLEMGTLYFRMGSFDMARSYFNKALAANPPPEIKARAEQYLAQIGNEASPSRLTGYLLLGTQYQSDANVAPGSPLINSPIGPLLLSSEFVKKRDENVFLTGSALYSYDLGTADRDTFEVAGTGFVQHYFRVQRLELDFGEVTAGPRFQFPDPGIPGVQSASLKPYAIVNEVGLGQNQYFYTYGSGIEGTATVWQDLTAKLDFEFRHKTFSNQPNFPAATGLDGNDKLVTLALTKPVTANSALSAEFNFLDQDTSLPFYSNKSYSGSASYRIRYDDPTGLVGLPWETTISGSRLWSFYGAPDPCCNTSGNPTVFSASSRYDRHWRFGLTQVFQVDRDIGVILQFQRDIVSSNLPLYAYTSNSVLVGPQWRFAASPGAGADDMAALQAKQDPAPDQTARDASDLSSVTEYRLEGGIGGAFGSNHGKAAVTARSVTIDTNNVTLGGNGLAGSVALWADGPLAAWTGNPALGNFSLGFEYRHLDNSGTTNVTATIPPSGLLLGGSVTGSVNGNFDSENLMVDAAWRLNSGNVHPYIGAGGGVAFIDWSGKLNVPALGSSLSAGILAPVAAGHTFIGLDCDITPNLYLGAGADFYFTDTVAKKFTHTNIQLSADQFSLLGHAGYRF